MEQNKTKKTPSIIPCLVSASVLAFEDWLRTKGYSLTLEPSQMSSDILWLPWKPRACTAHKSRTQVYIFEKLARRLHETQPGTSLDTVTWHTQLVAFTHVNLTCVQLANGNVHLCGQMITYVNFWDLRCPSGADRQMLRSYPEILQTPH